jgi:hypothetical protein
MLTVLITVLLSGCSFCDSVENTVYHQQEVDIQKSDKTESCNSSKEQEVSNIVCENIDTTKEDYELLSKDQPREHRFYSPDKKNFVREIFYPNEEDFSFGYVDTKLYLNDSKIDFDQHFYQDFFNKESRTPTIWIDNKNILVNGKYILNIDTNTKDYIDFSEVVEKGKWLTKKEIDSSEDIKKSKWASNYRFNKQTNQIAYVFVEADYSGQDTLEQVYLYDLKNRKWELIHEEKCYIEKGTPYGISCFQVFWDDQNNLYFDICGIDIIYKIYQYDSSDKSISLYHTKDMLYSASPSGRYLVLRHYDDEESSDLYTIINPNTHEVIDTFTNNYFAWADDNTSTLAVIKNKEIVILSCDEKIVIKKIDIGKFYNDNSTVNLDYNNQYFIFYIDKDEGILIDAYKIH